MNMAMILSDLHIMFAGEKCDSTSGFEFQLKPNSGHRMFRDSSNYVYLTDSAGKQIHKTKHIAWIKWNEEQEKYLMRFNIKHYPLEKHFNGIMFDLK